MIKNRKKLEKYEVMDTYNLSDRNYHTKLKNGLEIYSENQLKKVGRGRYEVDETIMDNLFQRVRKPNRNDNRGIRDYVLNSQFDYKGCIKPHSMSGKENVETINHIFRKMVDELYPNYLNLFYFIEDNNKQKSKEYSITLSHTHFLIQTDIKNDFIQPSTQIIKGYVNGKPFIQKYDSDRWEIEGKSYCVKDLTKDSLCGYLTYKRRN